MVCRVKVFVGRSEKTTNKTNLDKNKKALFQMNGGFELNRYRVLNEYR